MITQEQVKQKLKYFNGQLIWIVKGSNHVKQGSVAGHFGKSDYSRIGLYGKQYKLHRIVFLFHYGYLPKSVDHIDGNPSNNHIENLRECTQIENCRNSKRRSDNRSGIKGVCWHKQHEKWYASISVNKKQCFIGLFSELEGAKDAVDKERIKHHGEFANYG